MCLETSIAISQNNMSAESDNIWTWILYFLGYFFFYFQSFTFYCILHNIQSVIGNLMFRLCRCILLFHCLKLTGHHTYRVGQTQHDFKKFFKPASNTPATLVVYLSMPNFKAFCITHILTYSFNFFLFLSIDFQVYKDKHFQTIYT